jgi:5-formyltetrahydrofolate cyclo-ligase
MDAVDWRRQARSRLIESRRNLPEAERAVCTDAVEGFLEEIFSLLQPGIVSAYWPFNGEIDVRPLMERLRTLGWRTALPVVVGRRLPLEFRSWHTDSVMEVGPFKIHEPRAGELLQPDVIVIPLVGFDEENYRLGYGSGYYDITLQAMSSTNPLSIGVGFELARLETIYPMDLDVPMDIIVTEHGIQKRALTG